MKWLFLNSMLLQVTRRWGQVLLITGSGQLGVQVLAFMSGLLVIRMLAPEQYAFYTIANTALGAMNVLSDSGVSVGVMARGGRVWQDRDALGSVLGTGLALRRRLAAIVLTVALPATYLLMQRHGATQLLAITVTASIVPLFLATLTTNMLEVVPRLHQEFGPLQRIQLTANAGRFAALLVALPLLPFATVATLVAAVPQAWANWRLRLQAARHADVTTTEDIEIRNALLGQVRRSLPLALYYAVSGQLTVLLVSLLGSTQDVAAVGALGRLSMILSAVGAAFTMVALPRFARVPANSPATIRRRYWQAQAALAAVCALPLLLMLYLPGPILALLGPNYQGLEREAVLFMLSSLFSAVTGGAYALGAARSVIAPPLFSLPYCVAGQVILVAMLPVDTVTGVIWLSVYSSLSQWFLHVAYFYFRMARIQAPAH